MYPQRRFKNCLPSWVLNCAPDVNVSVQHVVTNPFPSMSMVGQSTSPLMRKEAKHDVLQYYLNKGDYSKTITYAEIMKNVADKTKNPLLQLYSYIYQAQAQMMSGREKIAKKNLNLSLELATKLNNDSTLCSVYGSLGLYSANIETDYYRAIRWLYKGTQNHLL